MSKDDPDAGHILSCTWIRNNGDYFKTSCNTSLKMANPNAGMNHIKYCYQCGKSVVFKAEKG